MSIKLGFRYRLGMGQAILEEEDLLDPEYAHLEEGDLVPYQNEDKLRSWPCYDSAAEALEDFDNDDYWEGCEITDWVIYKVSLVSRVAQWLLLHMSWRLRYTWVGETIQRFIWVGVTPKS